MLNSENINEHKDQLLNDIKKQYQNISNCNNIYYEELKEDGREKIINLFFFLNEKGDNKILDKIKNCFDLFNEKIKKQNNKEKEQIKSIDKKQKNEILVYKKFALNIQNQEIKKQQNRLTTLYCVNFPLAIRTTNYYNFLNKFNNEYKIKFNDELFNNQIFNMYDEISYKNKTFILPLPYLIYPENKNNIKPYTYYPYLLKNQSPKEKPIKKLKDEDEKEQKNDLNEIYDLYWNTLKDSLWYKKYKSPGYKQIDIILNDYENEKNEEKETNKEYKLNKESYEILIKKNKELEKENQKLKNDYEEKLKVKNMENEKLNKGVEQLKNGIDKDIDKIEIEIQNLKKLSNTLNYANILNDKIIKEINERIDNFEKIKKSMLDKCKK